MRALVAAGIWSLAYGALGLYWALGGAGFPFGEGDPEAGQYSLFAGARAGVAGPIIAVLGVLGAIFAFAMMRPWGRRVPRFVLLGFAWGACLILLLIIPDIRLLTALGYLPALLTRIGLEAVTWPVVNQVVCVLGGIAWGAAALAYGRIGGEASERCPAGASGPRWGPWVTYAAVLAPLPYAVSRLAWAFGIPLGVSETFLTDLAASGATIAEVSLGGMALAGALLTLGLVQRWGEVFPGWIPGIGGKRVPPALAIVPATVAAIALVVGGLGLYRQLLLFGLPVEEDGWGAGAPALVFFPWGVLLGLAIYAYAERRRCEDGAFRET